MSLNRRQPSASAVSVEASTVRTKDLEADAARSANSPAGDQNFTIYSLNSKGTCCEYVSVLLNSCEIVCVPDTGASVSVLPAKLCT